MTKCNYCDKEADFACFDCYKSLCEEHCIEYPVSQLTGRDGQYN